MRKLFHLFYLASIVAIALLFLELSGHIAVLNDTTREYTLALGLAVPFFLLFLGYVELRNEKEFVAWAVLGIVFLVIYLLHKDEPQLYFKTGSSLRYLRCLPGFLLVFRVGRLIFLKVLGREYITPSIGGTSDILEGKQPKLADFIMFVALFLLTIVAAGF